MSKRIEINLFSVKSIQNAKKEVDQYHKEFDKKVQLLVDRLIDVGIEIASNNLGSYGKYISITKDLDAETYGIKGIMYMTNTGIIRSEWYGADGEVKSADISPMLMVEFGAGNYAKNPLNVDGVGQGTFPGQTHAFQSGWWYKTLDNVWHYSSGVRPSQPIFKARNEMLNQAIKVAKEVFK